ncbi:hypothetical protein [Mucilaginibacter phyllosphaerae]|uniref:Uncharacterized protein n=1 Tax=Mucilaginibacter phyllosphaerae TaxID=1812349 RepID=A0A4Y8A952_9SPHI|nr:hypothetical protein [Mucilaginibacter phyllosphaerae]MBB3969613.1 hypothetical protein [Mucilaginibacter phyllosphaerae]TEW65000.1 hypothetical protein E2R65_13850 [Mucilaginibacter phyllosphaerae]GGH18601.1 hypothetical protein GCM10007352_29440 [Mucilaginibacter phyllosphaerae]
MKIIVLCFWIILTRVGYFFLIQGNHDGLYYMKMNNLKDISQYLIVATFLALYYHKQLSAKIKQLIVFTIVYCLSFTCIMLYPFMGSEFRGNSEPFLIAYNAFWAYAVAAMFLYIVFSSDKFSTKSTEV